MNAKDEFLMHVVDQKLVQCAVIVINGIDGVDTILLKNWNEKEMESFLNKIDVEYDNGYGAQYLNGTIWMNDGTWIRRAEYDGSEWWEHMKCPPIPKYLISDKNERRVKLDKLL
jgi:hypothetical protein